MGCILKKKKEILLLLNKNIILSKYKEVVLGS